MSELAASFKFFAWIFSLAVLMCTSPPFEALKVIHLLHFLGPLIIGAMVDLGDSEDKE